MKKLFFLFLAMYGMVLFAQVNEDVIYLKSGAVMRGKILENKPDEYVKIENRCGDVWVFKANDISNVNEAQVKVLDVSETVTENTDELNLFFSQTNQLFLNSNVDPFLSLEILLGNRFRGNYGVGIGGGITIMENTLYPVYSDFRYYIRSKPNSPYLEVKLGYIIPAKVADENTFREVNGGMLFGIETGLATRLGKDGLFEIKIGYLRLNYTEIDRNQWWIDYVTETDYKLNRIVFGIGFTFF